MTNEQFKKLKADLWASADQLRANSGLKSTEYATPILGLITPTPDEWQVGGLAKDVL